MKIKIDFNNPEDFRRAERLTYDGTLDYFDFPPPEYKYFAELRRIYQAFKFEGLSQQDAERQKKSLLIDYRKYLETFGSAVQTYRNYQDNIRKSGTLISRLYKSEDVYEIAVLACNAVGLMRGDSSFTHDMTKKLEELK